MSVEKKRRGSMTAAELMAQLEADPEFQRRRAEDEAFFRERKRVLAAAEAPIVADLRSAGVEVDSVWDLVNTSVPYPDALPVLVAHLERGGYPDRVMESLASALAVKPASVYWQTFRRLYEGAVGKGEREGLAVAMAASATPEHFEAMVEILGDLAWGDNRIHLLRAIKRVGGMRGREVISALTDDPVLGKEASILMKKKRS